MDALREFAGWRPEVDSLDAATADRIWSELTGVEPADLELVTPVAPQAPLEERRRTRPWPIVAAVAAMAVGLAGLVVVQGRGGADVPGVASTPSTPPDSPTSSGPMGDPAGVGDAWSTFPSPPVAPRLEQAVAATPGGLFVWGGCCFDGDVGPFADGAYYDGSTWRAVPDAPLTPTVGGPAAVAWTGSDVLVVTGIDPVEAARFDLETFRWRAATPPTERRVGNEVTQLHRLDDGTLAYVADQTIRFYDAANDRWTSPTSRAGATAVDLQGEVVGVAASGRFVATLANAGRVGCGSGQFARTDAEDGSRLVATLDDDFQATVLAGVPDGAFLLVGHRCTDPTAPRAMSVAADGSIVEVAAPPVVVDRSTRAPAVVDHWVVLLSRTHSALMSYDWAAGTWSVGPSPGLVDGESFLRDAPVVPFGAGVVLLTPSLGTWDAQGEPTCCTFDPQSYLGVVPGAILTENVMPTTTVRIPTTAPSQPVQDELVDPTLAGGGRLLFANASTVGGVAGFVSLAARRAGFDVLEPVNADPAVGTIDRSVAYVRPGSEALADLVAGAVPVAVMEPMPASLPIDSSDIDHGDVDVLVVIGDDLAAVPSIGEGFDQTPRVVTVLDAGAGWEQTLDVAEQLTGEGVVVDEVDSATITVDETMLMPVCCENGWTLALADLIGVGGYDTWSADLAAEPLGDDVTVVVLVGTDGAPGLRE